MAETQYTRLSPRVVEDNNTRWPRRSMRKLGHTHHVGLLSSWLIHTPPLLLVPCIYLRTSSEYTHRRTLLPVESREILSLLSRSFLHHDSAFSSIRHSLRTIALLAFHPALSLSLPFREAQLVRSRMSNCIPVVGAVVTLCRRLAHGRKKVVVGRYLRSLTED